MTGERTAGKPIVIVTLPERPDDFRDLRAYIIESLSCGVLVLSRDMELRVETIPDLEGVEIRPTADIVLRGHDYSAPQPKTQSIASRKRQEEKNNILERLKKYREANGLGCLSQLADSCKKSYKITADTLRNMLNGSAVLPIEEWREVGRALDKVGGNG